MVFEYAQLKGTLDGMDTTVITELSEYFEKELGYVQPSRTPFVGKNFNVTRAGIHADGLLKNEEIYNVFDTGKFLNRPPLVAVSNTSGLAGIAHWINTIGFATSVIATSKHNLNGLSLMKATILRVSYAKDETSAFSRSAPSRRKEVTPCAKRHSIPHG